MKRNIEAYCPILSQMADHFTKTAVLGCGLEMKAYYGVLAEAQTQVAVWYAAGFFARSKADHRVPTCSNAKLAATMP